MGKHPWLHPQAEAALHEHASLENVLLPGRPGFDLARARCEERARLSSNGLPPRAAACVADVDASGVPCRLYRPRTGAPVLLYVHGGGWVLGGIDQCEPICRELAHRSGWAVLAVGYRLAPEHRYPAALEDVERVVRWLADSAPAYGLRATPLGLAGDSAGANLCAALTLRARDRGEPTYRFQALVTPVLDLELNESTPSRAQFSVGFGLDMTQLGWFAEQYVPRAADRARTDVSPLRARLLTGLPPTLVLTAECDPVRDEGERYAAALAQAGVQASATRHLGIIHGMLDPTRFDVGHVMASQIAGALRDVAATHASALSAETAL
jgi:acetyl esterase